MERYDDAWVRKMAAEEARKGGGLVSSRFAECKTLFDVIEVLDEILWVAPKAEKASEPKPTATLGAVREFVAPVREAASTGNLARLANGLARGATHVGDES